MIIIGAGPAGGQCARELARAGKKVLLVEKARKFSENSFSSAGGPQEIMEAFGLPDTLVGSYWHRLTLFEAENRYVWETPRYRGVILDFTKLRTFLAEEAMAQRAEVMLGWSYQGHADLNGKTAVWFNHPESRETQAFLTKVLVDATGCERKVLLNGNYNKRRAIVGTAIEYLVEVDSQSYQTYASALSIFVGLKWMPQGYAWIFPMQPNQLKVGVGRSFPQESIVPHQKSYRYYLEQLIRDGLKADKLCILDRHGKTLYYTPHRGDLHYEQNVVAIGDSVSTINPLTFEGIRHAMMSGRIAAKHILEFLSGRTSSFKGYVSEIRRYCGIRWLVSEVLMKKIYREPDGKKIHLMLKALKGFTFQEMMDLAFHYSPRKALKFYIGYLLLNARGFLNR